MDVYWQQASKQVELLCSKGSFIIAPVEFNSNYYRNAGISTSINNISDFSLFVIHKGRLDDHSIDFLTHLAEKFYIQYANEVFIIFGNIQRKENSEMLRHASSFYDKLKYLKSRLEKNVIKINDRPSHYMGNSRSLTKTIYGHKMILDTRDLSLAPHILLDGEWEAWITKVFVDFLKPGMKVLDIGANIGYYSLLAADKIGKEGYLTSFEANPDLASLIFHNLHLNGFHNRSKVVNKAVYSHTTTLEFNIYENYMGSSSIWADSLHAAAFNDKLRKIEVEAISLDEYFKDNFRVDFIKIDAEGAEPHILKGASNVIINNPNIIILMEFAPPVLEVSYGSIEKFYNDISAYGLNIYKINTDSTLSLMNLDDAKKITWTDVLLRR